MQGNRKDLCGREAEGYWYRALGEKVQFNIKPPKNLERLTASDVNFPTTSFSWTQFLITRRCMRIPFMGVKENIWPQRESLWG